MEIHGDPAVIVIFGASGDLTQRKLVPALHSLACDTLLPAKLEILGVARSEFTDESFRDHLYEGVEAYSRHDPEACELWSDFAGRYHYLRGEYNDPETYRRLRERLEQFDKESGTQGNRLFYLSVPPVAYALIVERLGEAGLNHSGQGWVRVVVEKPFGHDFESARALNHRMHEVFDEEQIYRIDHYLGKETVQNILTFRFSNAIFEPLWSRVYIDHVQISVTESIDVGRRAGYYDEAGVLRDMFQNHLLQLATLTAMEPPAVTDAYALRDEKVKVLHAVRPPTPEDLVLGQYKGYRGTNGVGQDSETPTFAALRLFIDNWRWQGVPFYLRSGKGLKEKITEITLQFRSAPHLPYPADKSIRSNHISMCISPDEGIHLSFETKRPGAGMRTKPATMEFAYAHDFGNAALPEAYERLLLDALQGDASLFTRADEIELAWQVIDRLTGIGDPILYEVGSWGPQEAADFMERDGCSWHYGCIGDECYSPA